MLIIGTAGGRGTASLGALSGESAEEEPLTARVKCGGRGGQRHVHHTALRTAGLKAYDMDREEHIILFFVFLNGAGVTAVRTYSQLRCNDTKFMIANLKINIESYN